MNKVRVLIATTTGPVDLLLLTEEDPVIGRSVACIGGTTETADIDPAYHSFVARATGIVERLFGHSCYRIDVSGRIDAGSSWQLAILAGHALFAAGRLAQEGDTADSILWATGSVRAVDLTVGAVGHVPEKLRRSLERLRQEADAGRHVIVAIPAVNAGEIDPELRAQLDAHGIEILELSSVQPLWDRLGVSPSAALPPTMPPLAPGTFGKAPRLRGRGAWMPVAAALLALLGAGAVGVYALTHLAPSGASLKQTVPPLAAAPRPTFKDCDACPEMVEIPEGYFQMGAAPSYSVRAGNETPQHTVRFARPFAIGKFEVTIDEFAAFVQATGYKPASECFIYAMDQDQWLSKPASFQSPTYAVTGQHPATCVTWHDAKAYAAWLSDRTGKPYRLPSEAEWEYAVRAGTTTPYSFGDFDHGSPCDYAKFADASTRFSWRLETCNSNHGHGAAPVGRHRPNGWGLHDMHGNVWEWVEDCWHGSYVNAPADGSAWLDGHDGDCSLRVVRGGSWHNILIGLRSTLRVGQRPTPAYVRGFRIARAPAP